MVTSTVIINTDSTGSGGVDLTNYTTSYKLAYNKLWGEDSGRNMKGEMAGTLVGIFPKLSVKVGQIKTTPEKAAEILGIVNGAFFYVSYYDVEKQEMITMKAYTGDVTATYYANTGMVAIDEFNIIAGAKR